MGWAGGAQSQKPPLSEAPPLSGCGPHFAPKMGQRLIFTAFRALNFPFQVCSGASPAQSLVWQRHCTCGAVRIPEPDLLRAALQTQHLCLGGTDPPPLKLRKAPRQDRLVLGGVPGGYSASCQGALPCPALADMPTHDRSKERASQEASPPGCCVGATLSMSPPGLLFPRSLLSLILPHSSRWEIPVAPASCLESGPPSVYLGVPPAEHVCTTAPPLCVRRGLRLLSLSPAWGVGPLPAPWSSHRILTALQPE